MLSKVSVDEVFNALFSEHVVSFFVTAAPPLDAAGGLLSPDPLICPPWKKSCAKHNGLSCIGPTHGSHSNYRTDSTDSRTIQWFCSAQRLDLFAWCVRLSRLLVGFRTHFFKSLQFYSTTKNSETCNYKWLAATGFDTGAKACCRLTLISVSTATSNAAHCVYKIWRQCSWIVHLIHRQILSAAMQTSSPIPLGAVLPPCVQSLYWQ